jgi:hypothetical protein
VLRDNGYEIAPLLTTLFLSRDFYSPAAVATRIKSPVELVISTYRKLGLTEVPGVPDFNEVTSALGQHLLYPPTVAGWAHGRSWITPGLLLARGNFAYDVLFPDIMFVPPDRLPSPVYNITYVGERLAQGYDVTSATAPMDREATSMSMMMADRDEDFNTRLASYRGWQMALQKVKPIPRHTAGIDLGGMVVAADARTAADAVDALAGRFLSVPMDAQTRARLASFLASELGTDDLREAESYMEEPLRVLLHLILSLPEYQLG